MGRTNDPQPSPIEGLTFPTRVTLDAGEYAQLMGELNDALGIATKQDARLTKIKGWVEWFDAGGGSARALAGIRDVLDGKEDENGN